jgi:hypothetical protein
MVKLLRRIINLFKKCKMARINNIAAYAISNTVDGSDIVIGSENGNGGDTKNFQMSDIATYVMSVNTLTLQDVCDNGSATTTGITVAGTTTLNGTLDANSTADISGNTTIGGTLGVTGGATFSLGATINGAGLAVNGSGGIVVTDVAGITSFGPVSATALNSTGGLLVSGTSFLGEIDSAGPADIADALTLSKASGGSVNGTNGLALLSNGFTRLNIASTGEMTFLQQAQFTQKVIFSQSVPSSSTDTGSAGQIAVDATHVYVCVGTNSWGRVAIDTTPF